MVNMNNIMKQAQVMQKKMMEMQEKLASTNFTGDAGAGAVKITISGKYDVLEIKIDPSVIDPTDPDLLENLIQAAFNAAKAKLEEFSQGGISNMLGGMQLPTGF